MVMPDITTPGMVTAAAAIRDLSARFREAGLDTPDLDARILVLAAAGLSREAYVLEPNRPLAPKEAAEAESFALRRLAREPVSRILGRREFWGRDFLLGPATLDPRPETETLVEAVLAAIDAQGRRHMPLRLIDLGTGTGCILLSLLAELPMAWGVGLDISEPALAVARRNALMHGLGDRALFCRGDWAECFSATFDFIFSNPPYIRTGDIAALDREVRDHDPRGALDGGADGLDAYRRIAISAAPILAPGGQLALEAGDGQMGQLCELLAQAGWQHASTTPRISKDLLGVDRVVIVAKPK